MLPLHLTDTVVRQIAEEIAAHPPERGAVGLGLRGHNIVTTLIPDLAATTTSVSYVPSARVTEEVNLAECEGATELKLIVHSHPGHFDSLSQPDRHALASTLAMNPHLSCIAAPVVTLGHPLRGEEKTPKHVLALPGGARVTFYGAIRGERGEDLPGTARLSGDEMAPEWISQSRDADCGNRSSRRGRWSDTADSLAPIEIFRWPVRVVPVEEQVTAFASRLSAATNTAAPIPRLGYNLVDGVPMMTAALEGKFGDWIFLLPGDYPWAAPIALRTLPGGCTEAVALVWTPGDVDKDALWKAMGGDVPPLPRKPVRCPRSSTIERETPKVGVCQGSCLPSETKPVEDLKVGCGHRRRFLRCRDFDVEIPCCSASR